MNLKKSTPQDKENKIKVKNLENNIIYEADIDMVEMESKKIYKESIMQFVPWSLFLLLPLASLLQLGLPDNDISKIPSYLLTLGISLSIFIGFLYVVVCLFKNIHFSKNCSYQKAQYGIVESKYRKVGSSGGGSSNYIFVRFPESGKFITVTTYQKNFWKLQKNDSVLVLSFNNIDAFILKSNVQEKSNIDLASFTNTVSRITSIKEQF